MQGKYNPFKKLDSLEADNASTRFMFWLLLFILPIAAFLHSQYYISAGLLASVPYFLSTRLPESKFLRYAIVSGLIILALVI